MIDGLLTFEEICDAKTVRATERCDQFFSLSLSLSKCLYVGVINKYGV